MPKLMLKPTLASYEADFGVDYLTTEVGGGPARRRRSYVGSPHFVTVQWILQKAEYDYSQAFYSTSINNGVDRFTLDLITDSEEVKEHTVAITQGGWSMVPLGNGIFQLSCVLEVLPIARDAAEDNLTLFAFEFGGEENVCELFENVERMTNTCLARLAA